MCLFILFAVYRSAFAGVLCRIACGARHFRRFAARDSRRRKIFLLFDSRVRTCFFIQTHQTHQTDHAITISTEYIKIKRTNNQILSLLDLKIISSTTLGRKTLSSGATCCGRGRFCSKSTRVYQSCDGAASPPFNRAEND